MFPKCTLTNEFFFYIQEWLIRKYGIVTLCQYTPGLEVLKPEFSLQLKIKRIDWLLADTCLQAAKHCALFRV